MLSTRPVTSFTCYAWNQPRCIKPVSRCRSRRVATKAEASFIRVHPSPQSSLQLVRHRPRASDSKIQRARRTVIAHKTLVEKSILLVHVGLTEFSVPECPAQGNGKGL